MNPSTKGFQPPLIGFCSAAALCALSRSDAPPRADADASEASEQEVLLSSDAEVEEKKSAGEMNTSSFRLF